MPLKLLMAILGIVTELRMKKSRKRGAISGKFNGRQCQLNFAFSYGQKMSEFSKVWIAFQAADGHSEKDSLKCGNCQCQIS